MYELLLLNDKEGANNLGHGGVAIGNRKKGYYYYSNDGTDENFGIYGESKIVDGKYFSSREELLNADETKVRYGTARYDRALTLKITFEQANMIKLNLSNFLQSNYNLINNNCAHIWNVALKTINYNFKGNGFGPNVKFKALKFFYFPSIKFETRQSDKW